ncbi:MAG TPA: hypothetical protein V6D14_06030 [Coleofasciculaceae cyanobacterium]|jgi:hypothetical protein
MDKLTEYPKILKRILADYIELCSRRPNPELETLVVRVVNISNVGFLNVNPTYSDERSHYKLFAPNRKVYQEKGDNS